MNEPIGSPPLDPVKTHGVGDEKTSLLKLPTSLRAPKLRLRLYQASIVAGVASLLFAAALTVAAIATAPFSAGAALIIALPILGFAVLGVATIFYSVALIQADKGCRSLSRSGEKVPLKCNAEPYKTQIEQQNEFILKIKENGLCKTFIEFISPKIEFNKEGIFRKSGDSKKIEETLEYLSKITDANPIDSDLDIETDDCCGVIKSLISAYFDPFTQEELDAIQLDKIESVGLDGQQKGVFDQLFPAESKRKNQFRFLYNTIFSNVLANEETNLMTASNLSTVLTPRMIETNNNPGFEFLQTTSHNNEILALCLNHAKTIFTDSSEEVKAPPPQKKNNS